jgi:hypothetical protein
VRFRLIWMALVSVIALAAFGVGSASADPQKGDLLALECDTLGSVDVIVFGNGRGSPGLVVDSTQVGIPYKLHLEGTFTPAGGGDPETFVDEWEHPAPRNGRLDHCTFHQEDSDESGSVVLDGEVWISYTPTR